MQSVHQPILAFVDHSAHAEGTVRSQIGQSSVGDGQPAGRVDLPSTWGAGWLVVRARGKRGPPESFGTVHPYAAQWVVQQVELVEMILQEHLQRVQVQVVLL